jgi:hypothetical protein
VNDPDEAPELDEDFFKEAVLVRPGEDLIEKLQEHDLPCPLPRGTKVRMTRKFRKQMRWSGWKYHGVPSGRRHIREFGRCIGIVEGWMDYNSVPPGHPMYSLEKVGPEVNVRWWPRGSLRGLRYMYNVEDLEVVR